MAAPIKNWHSESAEFAAAQLKVEPASGLAAEVAKVRLVEYGPNRLAEKLPRPAWLKFLDQFKSFLILILIAAAILAGLVGDLPDAVVIALVVLANAVMGFMQEHRAEAALAALENMLAPVARVRRDGQLTEIPALELVPGDLLLLGGGDRIPASG